MEKVDIIRFTSTMDRVYISSSDESITAKGEEEDHHHHHHHLFTDSMMKTLCFTLGLLLLSACCCNAMLQAVQYSTAPGECCFNFYTKRIPLKRVSTITETHSACPNKAFIVRTIKERQFCYRESFQWAQNIYHQLHYTEGSG